MTRVLLSMLLLACAACATAPAPNAGDPKPQTERSVGLGDRAPEVAPGKVTLVMFWATWSEPSKKFHGKLEQIWRTRKDRAFAVRAISIDEEPNGLDEWKKTYGLTFPIEWDRDRRLVQIYRPACEPQIYVVDRAGIVRFAHCGYHDDERIETEIDSLL